MASSSNTSESRIYQRAWMRLALCACLTLAPVTVALLALTALIRTPPLPPTERVRVSVETPVALPEPPVEETRPQPLPVKPVEQDEAARTDSAPPLPAAQRPNPEVNQADNKAESGIDWRAHMRAVVVERAGTFGAPPAPEPMVSAPRSVPQDNEPIFWRDGHGNLVRDLGDNCRVEYQPSPIPDGLAPPPMVFCTRGPRLVLDLEPRRMPNDPAALGDPVNDPDAEENRKFAVTLTSDADPDRTTATP